MVDLAATGTSKRRSAKTRRLVVINRTKETSMSQVSSLPFVPSLAWIGIPILATISLAAAPQQDKVTRPAGPASLKQVLNDSWAALQRHDYEAAWKASLKATTIDPQNQLAWSYL
jgi:hypothetical protein